MYQDKLSILTSGRGLFNITDKVAGIVKQSKISDGLCHVFLQHTSASLIIGENADPEVQNDLERFMLRLIPDGDKLFKHVEEGIDDMPSHIRAVLTASFLTIPVKDKTLALGRWQGIFLWEHRFKTHQRNIIVSVF